MKNRLFLFCPLLIGSFGIFVLKNSPPHASAGYYQRAVIDKPVGCGPAPVADFDLDEKGKFIGLLPGWGNHSYRITTASDSAQVYFNQGLSFYYSYHMREAIASFREAARFDSTCAMAYWGQALAMGPTYNGGYAYKMTTDVPAALHLMNQYANTATLKERRLFRVMNQRYHPADTADTQRALLNRNYAEALRALLAEFPDDGDITALYIDAVMLVHPWEFWQNDGRPKAWTPELVALCEDLLKKAPNHPAALHYFIHLTEASRQPEVALFAADSLLKFFPGVAHMVHMSSHEYERTGKYEQGVLANEAADRNLGRYDSLAKSLSLPVHISHYFAVDAYCAISGAMYRKGLQKALTCRESAAPAPDNTYQQYLYMFPQFAMVRMGKWQAILNDTSQINPSWRYASLLNDFVRGMAFAKTGSLPQAETHLAQLRAKMKDRLLKENFTPYMSTPYEVAVIAENVLAATICRQQKNGEAAIKFFRKAIAAEDSLLYIEPKLWMIPARQYLGVMLLEQKKWKEAEKVYREDLVWNPGNGWSLLGLYQSLRVQEKQGELAKLHQAYLRSFSAADEIPPASAY